MTSPFSDNGSDLHRRAVADAAEVFDRMMREVEAGERPARPLGVADGLRLEQLGPEALTDLVAALGAYVDLVARAVQGPLAALWDGGDPSDLARPPVTMFGRAGEPASGAVWIHNGSSQPLGDVELRLTALCDKDGRRLRPGSARFAPRPASVPSRSSAALVLSLLVPERTRPNVYCGQVVADAVPNARVPLRLVVAP